MLTLADTSRAGTLDNVRTGAASLINICRLPCTELLHSWLADCDQSHSECRKKTHTERATPADYPTRLIALEKSRIRLVHTRNLPADALKDLRYIALSYPWGEPSINRRYLTTTDNLDRHHDSIPENELAPLHADAVKVARSLDIQYLWIDALCIIQGPGGDWGTEAERMDTTFSAAYCVIAASRCNGVADRMLKERPIQACFTLPHSGLVVSEDIDDFQGHVIDGSLNKRGWVLQERALARRTIYFSERQTYWECGSGVRCETLTKMTK